MKVVNCLKIGLVNPTIVEYEGKQLATQGLGIQSLVRKWRDEFHLYNASYNFVLTFNRKDFNAIQQRTMAGVKSVIELFEEQGVCCICRDDVIKDNSEELIPPKKLTQEFTEGNNKMVDQCGRDCSRCQFEGDCAYMHNKAR